MKNRFITLIIAVIAVANITGCSSVNLRRADELSIVKRGIVSDMKEVTLAGSSSGIGAATGGSIGAMIGANTRGGDFKTAIVGAVIGQIVGAFAGNEIEKKATEAAGLELFIKLEDGTEIALTQRKDDVQNINIGDRVRITQNGLKAKIEKI